MRVLMLHNRYVLPGGEEQSTAADVMLLTDYVHHVELVEQDNREIKRRCRTEDAAAVEQAVLEHREVGNRAPYEAFSANAGVLKNEVLIV